MLNAWRVVTVSPTTSGSPIPMRPTNVKHKSGCRKKIKYESKQSEVWTYKAHLHRVTRIKRTPRLWKQEKHMQETKPQCNRSLGYNNTMFRQFPVLLRKQMSVICLLFMLKMSQDKHGFHFILVSLYIRMFLHT
jgi:hypothetical protein